jgi:hypothetical protein
MIRTSGMSSALVSPSGLLRQSAAAAGRRTRWLDVAATLLAVLIVGGPALFTDNGFNYDFVNHLWLVSVQQHAIATHLSPTYFVNAAPIGVYSRTSRFTVARFMSLPAAWPR